MKCPKCGGNVATALVEEKVTHVVNVAGTRRRVKWAVDFETLGLVIFHSDADDKPCIFTPADGEKLLQDLVTWLLSEDDEIYPEIVHLFAESEVVSNDSR